MWAFMRDWRPGAVMVDWRASLVACWNARRPRRPPAADRRRCLDTPKERTSHVAYYAATVIIHRLHLRRHDTSDQTCALIFRIAAINGSSAAVNPGTTSVSMASTTALGD